MSAPQFESNFVHPPRASGAEPRRDSHFAGTGIERCRRANQSTRSAEDIARCCTRCVFVTRRAAGAPFSLVTYEEVLRHARQIADVTAKRYMPPWKPDAASPAFVGSRRLGDGDIALIGRWVKTGAPMGEVTASRTPLPVTDGWLSGEPDLVLTLPTYTLRADGLDVFRNFVVTIPGGGTRYVRGLQFRPRSRAVHHANIRIDRTPASRAFDEADPEPGYEGAILHSAEYPDGHFLGWTPAQAAPPSSDLAWGDRRQISSSSSTCARTGRPERSPMIGLYRAIRPEDAVMLRLGPQDLDMLDRTDGDLRLPVDAIVAIRTRTTAREVHAWAVLPDGTRRPLISIVDWDFNWQDRYRFAQPFWLPQGTTVAMSYTFDNSARNPRNPSSPPEHVSWGWRSSDEMGDVWIQMFTRGEADRQTLMRSANRKMTVEDAVGAEVLIAREPNHVNLRNDAALIYQELGEPERALVHFTAVARLTLSPRLPQQRGTLEALGRRDEAKGQHENRWSRSVMRARTTTWPTSFRRAARRGRRR